MRCRQPRTARFAAFLYGRQGMLKKRVCCYIDGFNVYHAIDDVNRAQRGALSHLKWLNLRALMCQFIDPNVHDVLDVNYFSAYTTWHPDREARHRQYVAALDYVGVNAVMGQFKKKDAYCKNCKTTYTAREEKESDVNIATYLISDAYDDKFDQAFLVTNDSDLLGPVRLVRARFPKKGLKMIAPPFRRHSKELWALATHRTQIQQPHLEACRLPETAQAEDGTVKFTCPPEYALKT